MRAGVWAAALLTAAVGCRPEQGATTTTSPDSSETSPDQETASNEEAAIKAIEKLGGKVKRDDKAPGKPVISVSLSGTQVADAGLKELKEFRGLDSLDLKDTNVTDAGVADLQQALPNLRIFR
jgi:hypothetical protein